MSDLDKIKEALEFYSDESKYNTPLYDKSDLNNVGMPFPDKGHQAREALNLLESTIAEEKRLREAVRNESQIFKHYKGGLYKYICPAMAESDSEVHAVYKGEDGRIWVRPMDEFSEKFSPVKASPQHPKEGE